MGNGEVSKEDSSTPETKTIYYGKNGYYVGQTKSGKRHGIGAFYYPNGDKYEGNWRENVKQGLGTFFTKKTGELYQGNYVNNNKEGKGVYFYQNGDRYHGEWRDNKRHGKGILYEEKGKFIGNFKFDMKNGKGRFEYKNGEVAYETWQNGKLISKIGFIGKSQYSEDENNEEIMEVGNQDDFVENADDELNNDYFNMNECDANNFGKFLDKNAIKQTEYNNQKHQSKFFPLEMAKMLKRKGMDKAGMLKLLQGLNDFVNESPDIENWTNENVVQWFRIIGYEKLEDKLKSSGVNGKVVLNYQNNSLITAILGITDKNEVSKLSKLLELLRSYKTEKYVKKSSNPGGDTGKDTGSDFGQTESNKEESNKEESNTENETGALSNPRRPGSVAAINNEEEFEKITKNQSVVNNNINYNNNLKNFNPGNHTSRNQKIPLRKSVSSSNIQIKNKLKHLLSEKYSKANIMEKITKQSKYFYSSLNITGLSFFFNMDELVHERKKIGQGGFSEVYLTKWQGKKVALKKLRIHKNFTKDNISKFINEINILSSLRHPNIVLYMGASIDKENYYMIYEYLPNGSLFDLIHSQNIKLEEKKILKIAFDTAIAIKYLHSRHIVHRDLKSSNILLDEQYNVKLSDFGLGRFIYQDEQGAKMGTRHWMAPEIMKGDVYETSADVFSYGMVLWELLTGEIPYHNIPPEQIEKVVAIEKKIVKVPKKGNIILRAICERCIKYDKKERVDLNKILELLSKTIKIADSQIIKAEICKFLI